MRSDAVTVDGYLGEVAEPWRPTSVALRELCTSELAGFTEEMRYGMPGYVRDDTVEIGWASQRRYLSLYVLRTDVLDAHRARLDGLSIGKGCIRYAKPEQVDLDVVRSMLRATASSRGPVC